MPSTYHSPPGGPLEADVRLGRARQNLRACRLCPADRLVCESEIKEELEIQHNAIIIFDAINIKHLSYKRLSQMKIYEAICVLLKFLAISCQFIFNELFRLIIKVSFVNTSVLFIIYHEAAVVITWCSRFCGF